MIKFWQRLHNPAWYHGHGKKPPFFEGWYYKLVSKDEKHRFAIIPGVFLHEDPSETHSFIQILNGTTGKTTYHRYQHFEAASDDFDVRIDRSHFQQDKISLNVQDEIAEITGELSFDNLTPWASTAFWIGYMGPYAWIPNLECNHGVLSFQHDIDGTLNVDGQEIDFSGGRGYMEKDWGKSFPDGYIWFQSNHFEQDNVSISASVATLPLFGRTTVGFNVGLWIDGEQWIWSTYNGSKIDRLEVTDSTVEWVLYNKHSEIKMSVDRAEGGLLVGPERLAMQKHVDETMNASLTVEVDALDGYRRQPVFRGKGRNVALEVVGVLTKLLTTS